MAAEPETARASEDQPLSSGLAGWRPSLPTTFIGMLNPFTTDDANKTTADAANANKKTSFFSAILPNNAPTNASPASASPAPAPVDDESIMFAEPETRSNSDGGSRECSIDGKVKKSSRPKTRYSICHPPPASTARQRLHRRPRSLLQLHRLSPTARPQPAYEVVPSANFSVRLTKAIGKVFRAKHGLCPNDLVVLKAEKYSAAERDEEQEARDIIALICKGRKDDGQTAGKAKICFPQGREWEAYPTPNGGYEFFSTDEHGLGITVRWVLKKNKDACKSDRRKFNFSTISPSSRKHPVIAMLSKTSLDVNDTYKIPDPSAATPLSTPLSTPQRGATILADAMQEEAGDDELYETDDRLREIIAITGIWVAFKEGWSPNFRYEDKEKDSAGLQRSPSLVSSPSRAATFGSPVSTPPGSPLQNATSPAKRASTRSTGSGLLSKGNLLSKANRASATSTSEIENEEPSSPSVESVKKTGRTRADSASTVLVHRAASNRMKNNYASWRAEILSSQEEAREQASGEDLLRSQSESDAATAERRESIARPILPPASRPETPVHDPNNGAAPTIPAATARSSRRGSPFKAKRESTATSDTKSSASEFSKNPAKPVKKRSGWRRLFCGGGHDV